MNTTSLLVIAVFLTIASIFVAWFAAQESSRAWRLMYAGISAASLLLALHAFGSVLHAAG